MAYVEIKTINGRQYKYLRKTVRQGNKMQHISLKYLGPVSPVYRVGKSRKKSNASIYLRQLSEEEKAKLEIAARSSNAFTKDRAKILLLSSQGFFARQIAEKTGCEARKVRKAVRSFNEKGLAALQKGKAKGAVPKFDSLKKKIILMHFSQKPSKFDYHFTTWTLPRFKKHLVDYKVVDSISIEKVRQILNEAGVRLKRSKRWQYSPDKEFDKKNLQ